MNSTDAFFWLLDEFQNYAHGKVTWLHVREVLVKARQHGARFRAESAQSTESTGYKGPINLIWHGDSLPEMEEKVIDDIRATLWALAKPGDLSFHHVPLTDAGLDGPLVFVWGEKDDEAFHCEYEPKPKWRTSEEWKAESKDE